MPPTETVDGKWVGYDANKTWSHNGSHLPPMVWSGGICNLDDVTGIHIYTTLLVILAVFSTAENFTVLLIIAKNRVLHTPSMFLIGVLAGVDLATGVIVTPIKASLTQHSNILENIPLVKVFSVLFLGAVILSLSTVMLISFESFFRVYFLNNYNLTMKKLLFALACTWAFPVIFLLLLVSNTNVGYIGGIFALVYFFVCVVGMISSYVATIVTLKNYATNPYSEVSRCCCMRNHSLSLCPFFVGAKRV